MMLRLILGCWDIFGLFWLVTMFSTKRTLHRQTTGSRLGYWLLFLVAFWLLFRGTFPHRHLLLEQIVVPHSAGPNLIGLGLTVAGLGVAIWARVTLGRNWSGSVTFKENHELVVRGPYAMVRHPIYTGMLLMFLGTALAVGTLGGLVAVPLLFLSFWIKYRQEETLMIEHFGDQYRSYRVRVRALIPFLF
jgi:protein-S-isoprenylcysteine O-methyltransferase Ste14